MAQEKQRRNGKDAAAPRAGITLSPGKVTALCVLAVFAVAWAFVLGVVVGRGYRPETAVPEIDRIMPAPPAQNQTADLGVLKPEELNYMDQLSKTPSMPPKAAQAAREASEKAAREAAEKAAKKKAEAARATRTETPKDAKSPGKDAGRTAAKTAQPPAPDGVTAQKAVPAPAPAAMQVQKSPPQAAKVPEAASADEAGRRFAYVYQVAAVDNPAGAQALANKIRTTGLFATVEATSVNGKTWHRVLVQFRGTPDETREMKERLATVGVDRVIMKSKSPL